ncbi:MAG: prolipoprotein diacylglyceryl transferase [Clostridia bacterium]|nr:prolipoprotein diacylglyceryl transferase [Clostridia bacterium]
MRDTVEVFFNGLSNSFNVSSILAEFTLFGTNITIRWYGAIIAFGFLLAVLFGGRMAYKWKISLDKMLDVLIYGTIFGIIGARLYYCIFKWELYKDNPLDIFAIWEGGLAIYGGIIGGLGAAYVVCKVRKMNFWNLLDMASMSLLIGQGIGRWGNFANQEAFGTNTDLPWGMWSSKVATYIMGHQDEFAANGITMDPNKAVHPTFLYESIWCLLGFFVLYLICQKFRKFSGQIFLCYGVWYGLERAVVEGLRTDSLYIAGTTLRVSQVLSAALALACLVALIVLLIKYTKNPKPIDGIDFFLEEELRKEAEARGEVYEEKKSRKAKKAIKEEVKVASTESEETKNV